MGEPRDFETNAGGLWCHEVLERLGDAVDGAVSPDEGSRIQAHVASCDGCARFGAAYGGMLERLRAAGTPSTRPPGDLLARIRAAR
jgi:anti-sigma factor RsiW